MFSEFLTLRIMTTTLENHTHIFCILAENNVDLSQRLVSGAESNSQTGKSLVTGPVTYKTSCRIKI